MNAQTNVKLVKLQTIKTANYVKQDIFCTKVLALILAQKNLLEILRQTLVYKSAVMEKPMIQVLVDAYNVLWIKVT